MAAVAASEVSSSDSTPGVLLVRVPGSGLERGGGEV